MFAVRRAVPCKRTESPLRTWFCTIDGTSKAGCGTSSARQFYGDHWVGPSPTSRCRCKDNLKNIHLRPCDDGRRDRQRQGGDGGDIRGCGPRQRLPSPAMASGGHHAAEDRRCAPDVENEAIRRRPRRPTITIAVESPRWPGSMRNVAGRTPRGGLPESVGDRGSTGTAHSGPRYWAQCRTSSPGVRDRQTRRRNRRQRNRRHHSSSWQRTVVGEP